ncbi:exodeoxyribonuclease VII small subunit [uncultured Eubacterium sp.]|uniref:exodeoxyribonuclease VII small subunit n=1 Tax=uncultured Eubacterium sp. TaxID=165185 RepID=UPI00267380BC|nr:exodeoxyribonuclease VII small subunit [uncultured Eubacterium sp.]
MENNNSIEKNFKELDDIISEMSKDDISLEKSFELYNQGLKLVQNSNLQIGDMEKKIIVLNEGKDE